MKESKKNNQTARSAVVVPLGVGPSRAAFETAIAGLSRSAFRIWNYLIWAPPGAEVDVSPDAIQTRYPDISRRSYYLAMAELYEKRFLARDGRNGKTTLRAVWPDDETATRVAAVPEPEKPKMAISGFASLDFDAIAKEYEEQATVTDPDELRRL